MGRSRTSQWTAKPVQWLTHVDSSTSLLLRPFVNRARLSKWISIASGVYRCYVLLVCNLIILSSLAHSFFSWFDHLAQTRFRKLQGGANLRVLQKAWSPDQNLQNGEAMPLTYHGVPMAEISENPSFQWDHCSKWGSKKQHVSFLVTRFSLHLVF